MRDLLDVFEATQPGFCPREFTLLGRNGFPPLSSVLKRDKGTFWDGASLLDGDKLRMRDLLDVFEATQTGFCARGLSRSTTLLGALHAGLWGRLLVSILR